MHAHARAAQERRVRHGARRARLLVFAVEEPPGKRALVGVVEQGEVVQFPGERAVCRPGLGMHVLGAKPRLLERGDLTGGALGEAGPLNRARIPGQLFFQPRRRGVHQHRAPLLVHAGLARPAGPFKYARIQPLGRQYAKLERAGQIKALERVALGLQRELRGHQQDHRAGRRQL